MNQPSTVSDRALGAMFGLAIGDALGALLEFRTRESLKREGWVSELMGGGWLDLKPGEVTDETETALAAMQACINQSGATGLVNELLNWYRNKPKDMEYLTRASLYHLQNGTPDPDAARVAWEATSQSGAGNGALTRVVPITVAFFDDREARTRNVIAATMLTHYDTRCIEASLWLSGTLAALLAGQDAETALEQGRIDLEWARLHSDYPGDATISTGGVKDVTTWTDAAIMMLPETLDTSGYALATVQVGAWALMHSKNFEDGLLTVVNQGGDADAMGAVAGALLGALCGVQSIPARWLEVLSVRKSIQVGVETLLQRTQDTGL